MKQQNLAVELLEKLLKDEVRAKMASDAVQEKKYSERILSTLQKYHNRSVETAQVIEELISWAKEMAIDAEMASRLKLSTDEIAFYRALVLNEESVRVLGDDNLRQLAIELTRQLRKSATVDWNQRESVRARMRNLVRRLLRRWKYPPDDVAEAIDIVLEQAEALASGWANDDRVHVPTLRPFVFGDKKLYFYDEVSVLPEVMELARFTVRFDMPFETRVLELNMLGAYQDLMSVGIVNHDILESYFSLVGQLQAEFNTLEINEFTTTSSGVIWSIKEVREGSVDFEIVASFYDIATNVAGQLNTWADVALKLYVGYEIMKKGLAKLNPKPISSSCELSNKVKESAEKDTGQKH